MTFFMVSLTVSTAVLICGFIRAKRQEPLVAALKAEVDRLAAEKRIQERERNKYDRMLLDLQSGHCLRGYVHYHVHGTPHYYGWRVFEARHSDVIPFSELDTQTQEAIRCL